MDPIIDQIVQPVLQTGTAATAASYIVAMYKGAVPQAKDWSTILVAMVAGMVTTFLVMIVTIGVGGLNDRIIAAGVIQSIFAAAMASGISSADRRAEAYRKIKQNGNYIAPEDH